MADTGGGATGTCPPLNFYQLNFLFHFCIRMLQTNAVVTPLRATSYRVNDKFRHLRNCSVLSRSATYSEGILVTAT